MTTTKKNYKKISMLEFRAWLQGVEDLQPKDWHPNLEQWKMIRSKIDQINTIKEVVEKQNGQTAVYAQTPAYRIPGPYIAPAPLVHGGVPPTAVYDGPINPAIPGLLPGQKLNDNGAVVTPMGEVQNGSFKSAFA